MENNNFCTHCHHCNPARKEYKGLRVTRKQLEVLSLIEKEFSVSEMAHSMQVSQKAIKFHISMIYKFKELKHLNSSREALVDYLKKYKG